MVELIRLEPTRLGRFPDATIAFIKSILKKSGFGIFCLITFLVVFGLGMASAAYGAPVLRISVLKFGTVNWELDVIRHHGLDKKYGFRLAVTELAGTQATKVALQGGAADIIVTDWLWVTRQRMSGFDFTFSPFSSATGALIVQKGVRVKEITELEGKKIGVAGGPLDKSWLLLNAYAQKRFGFDLKASTTQIFGAPPLLNQLAIKGDVDAVLNYWHYSARLEAKGFTRVIEMSDVQKNLTNNEQAAAVIGYTFREAWANKNTKLLDGFLNAADDARQILQESDTEWERLAPLMRVENDEDALTLRQRYREGIPNMDGEGQERASRALYSVLQQYGGDALVGKSKGLMPGTFWE